MSIEGTPQFLRIESYARIPSKRAGRTGYRSAAGVVAELLRDPDACPHVAAPRPPLILWGDPQAALNAAVEMANSFRDPLGRRMRRDAHILAGCICSYPKPVSAVTGNAKHEEELREWIKKSMDWAFNYFRVKQVRAVVLHRDETMPHLHILITPPSPGIEPSPLRCAAKKARAAAGKAKRNSVERIAYIQEAERFQDSFFDAVSAHFGQTRHGTHKRRRMTRAEHNREKSQARALQLAKEKAKKVLRLVKENLRLAREYQQTAEEAQAQAAAARQEHDEYVRPTNAARQELDQCLREAKAARTERDKCLDQAAAVRSALTDAHRELAEARHRVAADQRRETAKVKSAKEYVDRILTIMSKDGHPAARDALQRATERAAQQALAEVDVSGGWADNVAPGR